MKVKAHTFITLTLIGLMIIVLVEIIPHRKKEVNQKLLTQKASWIKIITESDFLQFYTELDDVLIVGVGEYVTGLDKKTGKKLWQYAFAKQNTRHNKIIVQAPNILFVWKPFEKSSLSRLDPYTGEELWEYSKNKDAKEALNIWCSDNFVCISQINGAYDENQIEDIHLLTMDKGTEYFTYSSTDFSSTHRLQLTEDNYSDIDPILDNFALEWMTILRKNWGFSNPYDYKTLNDSTLSWANTERFECVGKVLIDTTTKEIYLGKNGDYFLRNETTLLHVRAMGDSYFNESFAFQKYQKGAKSVQNTYFKSSVSKIDYTKAVVAKGSFFVKAKIKKRKHYEREIFEICSYTNAFKYSLEERTKNKYYFYKKSIAYLQNNNLLQIHYPLKKKVYEYPLSSFNAFYISNIALDDKNVYVTLKGYPSKIYAFPLDENGGLSYLGTTE